MTFSPRRLLITIAFVLLIGATAALSVLVATFDLNSFRGQLSDELSSRLSLPVNLGQAHFSLKHGPSFEFNNLLVGQREASFHLSAEHVFFRLEVLPLLTGQFKFNEILFEEPAITLKIGQNQTPGGSHRRFFFDQSLISGSLIQSIRIKNGRFRIEDYRKSSTPFIMALENLRVVIDDLSLRESGSVDVRGDINLNNIRSPLRLSGDIRAGDATPFWNHAHYDLELRVSDLASDILSEHFRSLLPIKIYGHTDINLQVKGTPSAGMQFKSTLVGRDLGILVANRPEPILSNRIAVAGTWKNTEQFHKFTELDIEFSNLNFFGEANFDLAEVDPEIRMKFRAPRIALTDFNSFIPQSKSTEKETGGPPEITSGTLNLKEFAYVGPASRLAGPEMLKGIRKLELRLNKAGLRINENLDISDGYARILWADDKLQIEKLKLQAKGLLFNSNGEFRLDKDQATGQLKLDGQSTLNIRNLTSQQTLLPANGLNASLYLGASFDDSTWTLRDTVLVLPSMQMLFKGRWERNEARRLALDISIPNYELGSLPLVTPALKVIQARGDIVAAIHYEQTGSNPARLAGAIDLADVHFEIPGPLAPINDLNGIIALDWPQLSGQKLTARLGDSPIELGLDIPDLSQARIDLAIKGDSIRADELIFRSEKTYLRDVDALLSLTDKTLNLGPIHTRMDGGTNATVTGTIDNFPTADTYLKITGKYGNIDEVIGLWISDESRKSGTQKRKRRGKLEIDIETEAGEIAHLPFENSTGHISYRDRTLVIHPIKFRYGDGAGIGQVLVKYRDDQPPLLQMSGHLENFDALAVYQQLLQRKGIITGSLWGDFYLEGTAGNLKETFLPSSFGAFSFEVKDGTMMKLHNLSRVLTIFNIYPLFTSSGKEKGVPFELISGTGRIDQGVLRTGDLYMTGDVMNMSLSGTQNLITTEVDLDLGIMPLRTFDRVVTKIPLAGWVLGGDEQTLFTAQFRMTGPGDDPKIEAIPIESASKQIVGIFKRLITLPVKIISDVGKAIE